MRPLLALLALATPAAAQTSLSQQIALIAEDARAKVYVDCALPGVKLDCAFNAHGRPPMQSVFKFPLAVVVLQQVEAGKLSLDQQVRFLPSDLYKGTYSPLQDAHTEANVDVPLSELLRLSVQLSDNIATDILLRLIGGPKAVQQSLDKLNLGAIHVRDTERSMHDDEHRQYRNDAEPSAMVALLRLFADHSPLTPEHTALLNKLITETPSAPHRMKAGLPAGTPLAHKTGSSGVEGNIIPATNDVGLITLPNGKRLALAIFVTDAHANQETVESVMARIAKAVYDDAIIASK
jgi:beta-lactamase class A